jgi:hypothetical protein
MMDQTDNNDELKTRTDSVMESEASIQPTPIPNSAAAADRVSAPPVPINPDDLHDLFAGSPNLEGKDEEDPLAQLRNDPNYSALIRDLEYIASQARLLFAPAEEAPSDEVWSRIQNNLPPQSEES